MWTISQEKDWKTLEEKFAWVAVMKTVPQDIRHHAEGDVAIHTQMVLKALTELKDFQALSAQQQECLWASALLHDVEKYSTTVTEPDGSITAHGHARKGALTTRSILYREVPTPFPHREAITGLVRYHGLPLWLLEKPDPVKQAIKASMEVDTEWLALLARADVLGRICGDREELLYRIDCFEEFCKEKDCWGKPRDFASPAGRMDYLMREDGHPDYEPFEKPRFEVVLMSGLPGSGKDSHIRRRYKDWPVISLDGLREEMGVDPRDKSGNGQVIQAAKERARELLRKRTNFVWNGTNITRQMRSQLIELFMQYKASVRIVYIEVPYQRLMQQNRNREAVVPAAALEKLIRKLEVPAVWEAHEFDLIVDP